MRKEAPFDRAGLLPSGRPLRPFLHMTMAMLWANRSLCKRYAVGAVITTADMGQIRSFGYNGPAKGIPEDNCRGTEGTCGCLHAEDNAISRRSNPDGVIMFTTVAPCEMCAQRIINAGLKTVYTAEEYRDASGVKLLRRCGIEVCQMNWSKQMAMEFAALLLS